MDVFRSLNARGAHDDNSSLCRLDFRLAKTAACCLDADRKKRDIDLWTPP